MANEGSFEVEIKVLLGEKQNADNAIEQMKQRDPQMEMTDENSQLNHYFLRDGDFECLYNSISQLLSDEETEKLRYILFEGQNHSIRTRQKDDDLIFVVKAVADDSTAENGIAREEFETVIEGMSLDELDNMVLDCGFNYQSKWSRYRQEFNYKDYNVTVDKNAGYGYMAEFEKVVGENEDLDKVKSDIREEINELGLEELSQERLGRMFEHYNNNWEYYYGTDKTFLIY